MRTNRWLCFGALVAAIATAPSFALAQGWLEDRARTEGPGFRVGDFELHPGLGVEIGYDSNIYYTSDDDPLGTYRDSAILRATAHLLFSTRGAQRRQEGEAGGAGTASGEPDLTFRGGLAGSFYHYFNDIDRTNMEVDASLALVILPGRVFSVNITEEFGRSIRPFTENPGMPAGRSFARIQNNAGVLFNIATSGDVLRIGVGYNFGLDFFEDSQFQYGNNFRHTISLRETFRFLPQTGIVHDTDVVIVDYFGATSAMDGALVNDGIMLRSRIGINGALTNEFSVLVAAGYAAGFYTSPTASYDFEYESVVAQAEARWMIVPNARLVFGYDRDFQPSFVGNFYRRDRGYANFEAIIERVFLLGIDASFGYYEFGAIVEPDGTTPVGSSLSRGDFRLIVGLFAEYRFTDWLGVNGLLRYTGNFTDYTYFVDAMGTPLIDPADFNKFEAWLGVRVFY